jgi:hypothetical protein
MRPLGFALIVVSRYGISECLRACTEQFCKGFVSRRVLMRVNQCYGNKKISFGSAKAN